MIIRSIDDLPIIHKTGLRIIAENKPCYLTDLKSGVLDHLIQKHIAYANGQVIRDETREIISGDTRDELGRQLPKDKLYFFVQVGVVHIDRNGYTRRN